jgi:hypothetical protein
MDTSGRSGSPRLVRLLYASFEISDVLFELFIHLIDGVRIVSFHCFETRRHICHDADMAPNRILSFLFQEFRPEVVHFTQQTFHWAVGITAQNAPPLSFKFAIGFCLRPSAIHQALEFVQSVLGSFLIGLSFWSPGAYVGLLSCGILSFPAKIWLLWPKGAA